MRPSNIFFATIFLLATGTLILFGISTVGPMFSERRANETASSKKLEALTKPKIDFGNPSRGAKTPALTIVEYGDHNCQPCSVMEQDLLRIISDFPDKVRVVWKDFPNKDIHPDALAAAESARCAGIQGAFWPYHDLLMANQSSTGVENRLLMATKLGLDTDSFKSCLTSQATNPTVLRDVEEALRLQVDGTPYLFMGDRRVSGSIGYDQLKTFVEAALASVPAVKAPAPSTP